MLAQLATIPFETAASLAEKVAVSEPTVGRFCRTLGYSSFKDLKAHLRQDMGDQPWLIGDRLRDFQARHQAGEDQLVRGLELEMAALVAVYELAHSDEWVAVLKRLATARSVFVIDANGKVAYREIVREVTDEPDYESAMAATIKLL